MSFHVLNWLAYRHPSRIDIVECYLVPNGKGGRFGWPVAINYPVRWPAAAQNPINRSRFDSLATNYECAQSSKYFWITGCQTVEKRGRQKDNGYLCFGVE
jgi:hypothetical protein